MSTDRVPTEFLPRREVWLQIALAIARDGLPDPKDVSFYADPPGHAPFDDGLPYGCVTVQADDADQAARWAAWAGLDTAAPKVIGGGAATHFGPNGRRARAGWFWNVNGPGTVSAADVVEALESALTAVVSDDLADR